VLVCSLAILGGLGLLSGKFEEAQNNEPASVLPAGAESLAVHELAGRFPSGDTENAVTVFRRSAGLTESDRQSIVTHGQALGRDRPPGAGA